MWPMYMPTLKAYSESSPEWYKNFHNTFYLSQISGLTLLSYMDTMIDSNKEIVIRVKKEELLKKKVITIDKDILTIRKEEDLKAIDVEDMIKQMISNIFSANQQDVTTYMTCLGLAFQEPLNKKIDINPDILLQKTNLKNWYSVLKGFLNIWEFMFLYSITESTLITLLNSTKRIRQENLISNILSKFPIFEENENNEAESYIALWKLFTELRNVYSHTHGMMTQKAKMNLSGKIDIYKKSIEHLDLIFLSLLEPDSIFTKQSLQIDKFYLLSDKELNVFRNFIISLIEELSEINN